MLASEYNEPFRAEAAVVRYLRCAAETTQHRKVGWERSINTTESEYDFHAYTAEAV